MTDLTTSPKRLLQQADLRELVSAIRARDAWTEIDADRIDGHLRMRVLDIIRHEANVDTLGGVHDEFARLVRPSMRATLNAMSTPYAARWDTLADLIDNRIQQLASAPRVALRQRKHMPQLLDYIDLHPGKTQTEIGSALGLSKANLSRLLALAEDAGALNRTSEGNQKRVYPASPAVTPTPRSPRPAAQVWGNAVSTP